MAAVAVLGAGPHGRAIAHHLNDAYLYDDDPAVRCAPTIVGAHAYPWVIGAAMPAARRQIAVHVAHPRAQWAHHRGTVLFPTAYLDPEASVGEHVHVLPQAAVSHGCHLGDFVTVATGAVLCGEVWVDDDVFIGAHATIIHGGIKIGRGAVIGAGVTIKRDVAPGEVVK